MFLVSGIPRASTTLVAKFASLTPQAFCYAGETHLVSFLHNYFQHFPCNPNRLEDVIKILTTQLNTTMLEAPRYGVSQGAHPGNLIFSEQHVSELVLTVREALASGLYGAQLYAAGLSALESTLRDVSQRKLVGEKTPDSIFAINTYAESVAIKNLAVVREPLGVVRSMAARVAGGDPFSNVFGGGIESNIGIYLDYANAVTSAVEKGHSRLVRFEDLATDPRSALIAMYKEFDTVPDEDVLTFSEQGGNQEIADRAPMYYQRLKIKTDFAALSPVDIWKVVNLTQQVRDNMGYSNQALIEFGFDIPDKWPGPADIPEALIPMSGFNEPDIAISRLWKSRTIRCWMRGSARFVIYLPSRKSRTLQLNFNSHFPAEVLADGEATLTAFIGEKTKDQGAVRSGSAAVTLNLVLDEEDLRPIGDSGAYTMVTLSSSHVYCPMVHLDASWDQRLVSFHAVDWNLD